MFFLKFDLAKGGALASLTPPLVAPLIILIYFPKKKRVSERAKKRIYRQKHLRVTTNCV